jgi:hypothetical protein
MSIRGSRLPTSIFVLITLWTPAQAQLQLARDGETISQTSMKVPVPKALPLPDAQKLTLIDKAYLDAFSILRADNSCSRFYGGAAAIEALNALTHQLKPSHFDREISLRMNGTVAYVHNHATGLSYRLFEKAELNTNGPFYRSSFFPVDATVPRVGEFSANTREARVTILLHELGHMIQTGKDQWLLPNDGADPSLSKANTQHVIEICRAQINDLEHVTFEQTLATIRAESGLNSQMAAAEGAGGPSHSRSGSTDFLRQFGIQIEGRYEFCRSEIQIPQDH